MNRIALTRMAAVRTLHLSASSVRLPRFANPPQRDRRRAEFSTTPRRNATEDESFKSVAEKQQKLKRVLEQHPQLKEHMKELFEALKAEGMHYLVKYRSGVLRLTYAWTQALTSARVSQAGYKCSDSCSSRTSGRR